MTDRQTQLSSCRFAKGDRIFYDGDYMDGEPRPLGTVTRVLKNGYRIRWDDGYKDLPGPQGVYPESELGREGEANKRGD